MKMLIEIETDYSYQETFDIVSEGLRSADESLVLRKLDTDYNILATALAMIGVPHEDDSRRQFSPSRGHYAASHGEDDAVVVIGGLSENAAFIFDENYKFNRLGA